MSKKLFAEFEIPTYEQWRETAVSSLKGRPLEKLTSHTPDGIPVAPLYRQADIDHLTEQLTPPGHFPYTRGTSAAPAPWKIGQWFDAYHADRLNEQIREGIAQGQTAVFLTLEESATLTFTQTLLAEIDNSTLPFYWFSQQPLADVGLLTATAPAPLSGGIFNDPLAFLAMSGSLPLDALYSETAVLLNWRKANAPQFRPLAAMPLTYHEAGATAVQELAFMLATAVFHIRQLQQRGFDVNDIAPAIQAAFGISGDIFINIAKLRAARELWAQMIAAFDGDDGAQKLHIIACTARRNKSNLLPHTNLLRLTAEASAAAVGGANVIFTQRFDAAATAESTSFSRHLSVNIQHILQQEVGLTNLADPAGGAYYVEYLTSELAQQAWTLFQQIEREGGMLAALQNGLVQKLVADSAAKLQMRIAQRKNVLVGVNRYPAFDESYAVEESEQESERVMLTRRPELGDSLETVEDVINAVMQGANAKQITAVLRNGTENRTVSPIEMTSPHAGFEALRHRANQFTEENGRLPQLFAINLGDLPRHKPRTEFAREFVGVGGFELVDESRWKTAESAANATLASSADAAIICGHDDDYPDLVPEIARLLKEKRPSFPLLLAGYPKAHIEAFQAAGVDQFIHLRANCLEINQWLQERIIGS